MFSDPFPYGEKIERRDALKKVNTSWGDPPEADKAGTGVRAPLPCLSALRIRTGWAHPHDFRLQKKVNARENFPVGIVLEDLPPLDVSDQHIVQRPWGVDPGLSWHGTTLEGQKWNSKL
jgi:hypothetical protein